MNRIYQYGRWLLVAGLVVASLVACSKSRAPTKKAVGQLLTDMENARLEALAQFIGNKKAPAKATVHIVSMHCTANHSTRVYHCDTVATGVLNGASRTVEETIPLIREKGRWRVVRN